MSAPDRGTFRPPASDGNEAVFDEPWQAQILAMAFRLAEKGVFSSAQWSQTLGAELRDAAGTGKTDNQETYYAAALTALEKLAAAHGGVSDDNLKDRTEAWRRAYLNTPHGQPVKLEAGLKT